jgi:hypothetical protein
MDRKMFFRLALGVVLLAAISLSCQMVSDVSQLRSVATDVNVQGIATNVQGLATDVNVQGIATNVQGIATQVDLEGMATEANININGIATDINLEALQTQMGDILTGTLDVGGVISDITGMLGPDGTPATPNGFPTDIPVMTGHVSDMSGSPTSLAYTVDADMKDVVAFYRREMAARGWVEAAGSVVNDGSAVMTFQQGNRTARVNLEEDFFMGINVRITVQ